VGTAVIVEAVRTPIGKRGGALSGLHAAEILGRAQTALLERAGIEAAEVEQVVGGCVTQAGEQSNNITRRPGCTLGCPIRPAASPSTPSAARPSRPPTWSPASSRPARSTPASRAGGGDEPGAAGGGGPGRRGSAQAGFLEYRHAEPVRRRGADRAAAGLSRAEIDRFGLRSQTSAQLAWAQGRFDREVVPVKAPVLDADRQPTGETRTVDRDEGLRTTSLAALAGLRPVVEDGVHTAGTSSQISDGAPPSFWWRRAGHTNLACGRGPDRRPVPHRGRALLPPRWTHRGHRAGARRSGMTIGDIDLFESTRRSPRWCSPG